MADSKQNLLALAGIVVGLVGCSTQSTESIPQTPTSTTVTATIGQTSAQPTSAPTAKPAAGSDAEKIQTTGIGIIEQWWFGDGEQTYTELAQSLEPNIGETLAEGWLANVDTVPNISDQVRIIDMSTVRVEQDDATFQVRFQRRDNLGEDNLTFIEFKLVEGDWIAVQIR